MAKKSEAKKLEPSQEQVEAHILSVAKQWEKPLQRVLGRSIQTAREHEQAQAMLIDLKTAQNLIEDEEKHLLAPFKEGLKRLQERIKPAKTSIAKAILELKHQVLLYQESLAVQAVKEVSKEIKAAQKMGAEQLAKDIAETAERNAAPLVTGVSKRDKWEVTVLDKKALIEACLAGKLPLDVLEIDMSLLKKIYSGLGREGKEHGLEIVKGWTLVVQGE